MREVNEAGIYIYEACNVEDECEENKDNKWENDKPKINISTDETDFEQVTNLPYLGQKVLEDGRIEEDIQC